MDRNITRVSGLSPDWSHTATEDTIFSLLQLYDKNILQTELYIRYRGPVVIVMRLANGHEEFYVISGKDTETVRLSNVTLIQSRACAKAPVD